MHPTWVRFHRKDRAEERRRPLLTLDDTVEFFPLILGTLLTVQEKKDVAAFLRVRQLA